MFDRTNITFGVIDSGAIYTDAQREGARYNARQVSGVADLLQLASAFHLDALFIVPESTLWKRARRNKKRFFTDPANWTIKPARLANVVTGWNKGRRVRLIFPGIAEQSVWWPLHDMTDAREVFMTVATLQLWLGVEISEPIQTCKRLAIQGQLESKAPLLRLIEQPLQIFKDNNEKDVAFKRPLWTRELETKYLHVYDKDAMYLPAFACPFGAGEYAEYYNGFEFNHKLPGLWNVQLIATKKTPAGAAELLGGYDLDGWFYTPLLNIYRKQEYKIDVRRAYVWNNTARPMEGVYKACKGALSEFARGTVERTCVKMLYTQFAGWLGRNTPPAYPDPYYRPDIRNLIISEAKARLLANILDVYSRTGNMVAGVRTDALFYFSNEKDPAQALPWPITDKGAPWDEKRQAPKLPQYRHSYTVTGDAARDAWARLSTIAKVDDRLEGKGSK